MSSSPRNPSQITASIGRQFPGLTGKVPSLLSGLPASDRRELRKVQRLNELKLARKMSALATHHMQVLGLRYNEDVFEEYYNLHASSDSMRAMEEWVLDQFYKTLLGEQRSLDILTVRDGIEAIRDNPKAPKGRTYNSEELSHMAYHLTAVMSKTRRDVRKLFRQSMGLPASPRRQK